VVHLKFKYLELSHILKVVYGMRQMCIKCIKHYFNDSNISEVYILMQIIEFRQFFERPGTYQTVQKHQKCKKIIGMNKGRARDET
jgi:hypothetical protein